MAIAHASVSAFERWRATANDEAPPSIRRRVVALVAEVARRERGSPLRAEDSAVTVETRGTVFLLRDLTRPNDGRRNRVLGFDGRNVRDLDDFASHYELHGIPCQLDVPASAWERGVEEALASHGFELAGASFTAFADPREAPAPGAGPLVEELSPEMLDSALELLARGGARSEFEPTVRALRATELRTGSHRVYVAKIDGVARAVASSCQVDDAVYLAHAFTEPAFRGSGCQTALLARRTHDAARAGATLVVTDTLFDGPSRRNVERAGMRLAFSPGWWVRALGERPQPDPR